MPRVVSLVALSVLLAAWPARAQTSATPPPVSQAEQDERADENNPVKAVFFSLRNEFGNQLGDSWTDAFIVRSDRAWLTRNKQLRSKVGLLTRIDVPIVTSHSGTTTEVGLGDLYVQVLHVPWLTPHVALAMGSGVTLPTASSDTLGFGKWQLAPIVVPVWFFPGRKGFFLIRLQEHVSLAGDASRPAVNYLQTAPSVVYNFRPRWWMSVETEATTDWQHDNRVSFRTGVELGHVVARRFGVSVRPEIPWGANRTGDWTVKVVVTRYRVAT